MGSAVAIAIVFVGVALLLLKSQSSSGGLSEDGTPGKAGPAAAGPTNLISALANAIAQAEGYGVEGAIPTMANNPGDLVVGNVGYGTMGSGITIFGSVQDGWNALYRELNLIFSGASKIYNTEMTFAEMAAHWTLTEASPWANNVASALGVTVYTTLKDWMALNS